MPVHVVTPVFEGPLGVLFELISEQKVDIYEVRISDIVDAFVAEVAKITEARRLSHPSTAGEVIPDKGDGELGVRAEVGDDVDFLERASEFLVLAAILVELKSRRLLPGPDKVDDDEELYGFEERDRLLARLLELQAYSAAADAFAVLIARASRSVARAVGLDDRFKDLAPDLMVGVTPAKLANAFLRASAPKPAPPPVDLSHVTVEAVTVSEAVEELVGRLPREKRSTFRELTSHCTTRMQVIVRFLALLELCKRGRVELEQGETFGDLEVIWVGGSDGDERFGGSDGDGLDVSTEWDRSFDPRRSGGLALAAVGAQAASVPGSCGRDTSLEGIEEYEG